MKERQNFIPSDIALETKDNISILNDKYPLSALLYNTSVDCNITFL